MEVLNIFVATLGGNKINIHKSVTIWVGNMGPLDDIHSPQDP
jgi:hypothetical protein